MRLEIASSRKGGASQFVWKALVHHLRQLWGKTSLYVHNFSALCFCCDLKVLLNSLGENYHWRESDKYWQTTRTACCSWSIVSFLFSQEKQRNLVLVPRTHLILSATQCEQRLPELRCTHLCCSTSSSEIPSVSSGMATKLLRLWHKEMQHWMLTDVSSQL